MNHKRRRARLVHRAKTNGLQRIYLGFSVLQRSQLAATDGEVKNRSRDPFHQHDERCCVRRRTIVNNDSLGGHRRKSALGGPVCAIQAPTGAMASARPRKKCVAVVKRFVSE